MSNDFLSYLGVQQNIFKEIKHFHSITNMSTAYRIDPCSLGVMKFTILVDLLSLSLQRGCQFVDCLTSKPLRVSLNHHFADYVANNSQCLEWYEMVWPSGATPNASHEQKNFLINKFSFYFPSVDIYIIQEMNRDLWESGEGSFPHSAHLSHDPHLSNRSTQ